MANKLGQSTNYNTGSRGVPAPKMVAGGAVMPGHNKTESTNHEIKKVNSTGKTATQVAATGAMNKTTKGLILRQGIPTMNGKTPNGGNRALPTASTLGKRVAVSKA